jgi:F-type H+-transporting ATPase subunit b
MSPHDAHHIPWKELIAPQALNFTIFIGLLVYFLKKPVAAHFSGKRDEFDSQKKAAEEARVQAEKHNFEVRKLLKELEETAATNLGNAKKEAQELKSKLINEAKAQSAKSAQEADSMAKFELDRAVSMLRDELISKSSNIATSKIKETTTDKMQTRLNDEFVTKAQGVRA